MSVAGTSNTHTESKGYTEQYLREIIEEGRNQNLKNNKKSENKQQNEKIQEQEFELMKLYEDKLEEQKQKYYQQLYEKDSTIKMLSSKVNELEQSIKKDPYGNIYESKPTAISDDVHGSPLLTLGGYSPETFKRYLFDSFLIFLYRQHFNGPVNKNNTNDYLKKFDWYDKTIFETVNEQSNNSQGTSGMMHNDNMKPYNISVSPKKMKVPKFAENVTKFHKSKYLDSYLLDDNVGIDKVYGKLLSNL